MATWKIILPLLVAGFMSSCATPVQVATDFDKEANFASYKTYQFTTQSMELPINDLNRSRLLQAIETELAAKGLTKATDNPDLAVDVQVKAESKQTATAYNTGGYGYGWRYGGGTTTINYDDYTEGTMFISLVDMKEKHLVWQGIGTKAVDEKASAEKREKNIKEAVNLIMAGYPPKMK